MTNCRVGFGYDIHRFIVDRKLILGGVEIPYPKGLSGHSDADVLTHAVCDAFLGAVGLPDIGTQFPDDDPTYADISSIDLLKNVIRMISERNYHLINLDVTIIAEEPRMAPFRDKIANSIAKIIGIDPTFISVKAKTMEGLGEIGEGEAIACFAIALLERFNNRDTK